MRRPPVPVTIHRLGPDFAGLGTDAAGREWSVRAAPVGAVVEAVGRPHKGIRVGLARAAPDAVAPRCDRFGTCGGCQLQEMPLHRQREEKGRAVSALLAPLGGIDHGIDGAPEAYGWRNKLELSFLAERYFLPHELGGDEGRDGRWLGMHAAGRFDRVVDTPRCELVSERMNAVLAAVRRDLAEAPWPCWHAHRQTGFFRHLVLREGDQLLASIHTTTGDADQAAWLAARAPTWGADAVAWYENDLPADTPAGTLRAALVGEAVLRETLGGVHHQLSPSAFFQVNQAGAELLVGWVRALLGRGNRTLWDLYCGTGALGLACARDVEHLVGVEAHAPAIEDARANAARNGIGNATFHAAPVEELVPVLSRSLAGRRPLAVIVDPPRNGLHPRALEFVAGLDAEVLLYVACRPSSLLRDGRALLAAGWTLTDRVAVDLFPQTAHVEVVSRWVRG